MTCFLIESAMRCRYWLLLSAEKNQCYVSYFLPHLSSQILSEWKSECLQIIIFFAFAESVKDIQRYKVTPGFLLLYVPSVIVVLKVAGAQVVCSGAGFHRELNVFGSKSQSGICVWIINQCIFFLCGVTVYFKWVIWVKSFCIFSKADVECRKTHWISI